MTEQIKTPKGIKILSGSIFVMGLALIGLEIKFLLGLSIPNIIFLNSLLIIASIGLWKRKEWGLFAALVACGAVISFNIVWVPLYIDVIKTYTSIWDFLWAIVTGVPMIFAFISIVYLWKKKNLFTNGDRPF